MRKPFVVLVLCSAVFAQDANIYDVKYRYDKAIRRIQGVQDWTVAGLDAQLKLVARVDSAESHDAVRLLCGESLDGYPLQIVVNPPPVAPPPTGRGDCSSCLCPCHRSVGQTVAEPAAPTKKVDPERVDDLAHETEQCDMLRKILGLPKRPAPNEVRCEQMVGWTNDPQKLRWIIANDLPHWRSQEMPGIAASKTKESVIACKDHRHAIGETVAYTYIRHRQTCPRGMKQLLEDFERMSPVQPQK